MIALAKPSPRNAFRICALMALACLLAGLSLAVFAHADEGQATQEAQVAQEETPTQAAIASCVKGLFASWGVDDSDGFYESDMMDLADGACTWLAFDVRRAGLESGGDKLVDRMKTHVSEAYVGDEKGLDSRSPTTWARVILVLNAFGVDPTSFGTNASGKPANLLDDGIFNWSYTKNLGDQGANAWIYALQALDALQVKAPEGAAYEEPDILAHLLACQAKDGSFALSEGSATGSVDLTGMALAALGPHKDDPGVSQAIEAALAYLVGQQDKNGGFSAEGESTSESCAMVIIGLSACGIDAATDERFSKGGKMLLDTLLSFQKADGTFGHLREDVAGNSRVQEIPTEQALRALLAYEEFIQGGDGNVYSIDFDISVPGLQAVGPDESTLDFSSSKWQVRFTSLALGAGIALEIVLLAWLVRRFSRKARR